jgi:integrase
VEHLKSRKTLLILDYFEHLIEACAELADALLRACPDLKRLATSREPLRVPGEQLRGAQPLPARTRTLAFHRRADGLRGGAALRRACRGGRFGLGTLINPSNLRNRSLKPLLKAAGLRPVRFHDLRHTCATLLLSKNVNPKIVSEMLGHASVSITLDVYSHLMPDMQEKVAKALG